VSDIVEGTLLAAEHADDGDAVNIGTTEGTRVMKAAELVISHAAAIVSRPEMPTGPYYRISDHSKLTKLAGWRPKVSFADGLERTMEWYFSTKSAASIRAELPHLLFER